MKKYKDLNTTSKLQRSQMWVPITIHEKVSLTTGDNGLSTVKWGYAVCPEGSTKVHRSLLCPT